MATATVQRDLYRFATAGERRVVKRLIAAALGDGYTVSISDGEEWTVKRSRDREQILDAMATTGADYVLMLEGDERISTITLVYGNDPDGSELIADYTLPMGGERINAFMRKHRFHH